MSDIPQLPDKTISEPIQLHADVTFQWLRGGKGFSIATVSSTRDAIDAYIAANLQVVRNWDSTQRFYSFQDVSHEKVTMTPYFREGLDRVSTEVLNCGIQGDSVVLMANTIMGKIVQVYGRVFAKKTAPVKQHWFTDREQAMRQFEAWMG